MAQVILLIGRVAAGKTYFARQYARERRAMLLSCDELMLTLYDGCLGPERHAEAQRRCCGFLFGQACRLTRLGIDALLDAGFWRAGERQWARDYFSAQGVEPVFYYLDTPAAQRRAWLAGRNAALASSPTRQYIIDEEMLARFDAMFEEPAPGEYQRLIRPGME